ncbi:MAG: ABC transporter permease [Sarcina sp.]
MKTYKDITKKYLVENKGRTFLTICGIILSVALITSIMLFVRGIHQTFINREINASGEYHVGFSGLTKDEYEKMIINPGVEQVGTLKKITEEGKIKGAKYDIKMVVEEITKGSQDLFPFDIEEGRFAENENEVVLESARAKELLKDIGDKVTIEIGKEKKEYTIVGLMDEQEDYYRLKAGTALLACDKADSINGFTAFKANKKAIRETVNNLKAMTNIEGIENYYLLQYLGASQSIGRNAAIAAMAMVIISMVVICTILVIRNAFYISIVSRTKEFGLLKAIGSTSTQLKKMILKEANIIAGIAIPFGLFFGTVAIIVIEKILKYLSGDSYLEMAIKFDWWIYVIAIALGIITTYFSALLPAREIKKLSAVEAIDNRKNIKKEKIKRKKFNLVEKFCGIRTIMAYRNIKRNRKRYVATVVSLSVCMIMIIVFASYMKTVKNDMLGYTSAAMETHDMSVYLNNEPQEKIKGFVKELQELKNTKVYEIMGKSGGHLSVIGHDKQINSQVLEEYKLGNRYTKKDGYTMVQDVSIEPYILDESMVELLNKYVINGQINKEYMEKNNGVILVSSNEYLGYEKGSKKYKGSLYNYKVGDTIYINKTMQEEHVLIGTDEYGNPKSVPKYTKENTLKYEVVAIVDELPENIFSNAEFIIDYDNLKKIETALSEDFKASVEYSLKTQEVILDIDNNLTEIEFENIKSKINKIAKEYNIKLFDEKKSLQESLQFMKQIQFLIYGFIMVITLISCTNIFNTMSTNILFRKSEIASLRAIGMSKKEIRSMIIKEGVLYGVISAFYGVVIGTAINYFLYIKVKQGMNTEFVFNPNIEIVLVVVLIATLVGVLASLMPLRKIDKATIIEDLKGE